MTTWFTSVLAYTQSVSATAYESVRPPVLVPWVLVSFHNKVSSFTSAICSHCLITEVMA